MNKGIAVSAFVALLACAGLGFSVNELRKVNGSVSALEERLLKLEGAPAATSSQGSSAPTGTTNLAEVTQEIKKLKAEMVLVKNEQDAIAAASKTGSTPHTDGGTAVKPVDGDIKAAVEAVLAAKEQEKKEADLKRTNEWMNRATTGMVETLTKQLGLTDTQKAQVTEILTKQSVAFREALTNRKDGEDTREKVYQVKTDTDLQIKAILTPEQGVKYDQVADSPMGLFGGGGGRRSGGSRGGPNGGD